MSARKLLMFMAMQASCVIAFAKGVNPKTWKEGQLYELSSDFNGFMHCLYIDPSGTFIFLSDFGDGEILDYSGIWKRNSFNGKIKLSQYADVKFSPLDYAYYVLEDGLYVNCMESPEFINASTKTKEFFLPQIKKQRNRSSLSREFLAMSEIGRLVEPYPWNLDGRPFTTEFLLDSLKGMESTAQMKSDAYFSKQESERLDWAVRYTAAWKFGRENFQLLENDSVKLRAMCNWMSENLEYKLEESRKMNPTSDPEFTFSNRFGLCMDYSVLLSVFCESVGIPCFVVKGYPIGTRKGKQESFGNSYHAWNYVKVGGEWKAVDPTWYHSSEPELHFLENLTAYQYEHVPEERQLRANPFGPSNAKELSLCPVVKQTTMDILYTGDFDRVTSADGDELEVVLYSSKETELSLVVDSTEYNHHTVTMSFCLGCPKRTEDIDEKKVYHLTRGLNRVKIPLTSVLARYTLKNEDFEIAFIASPERYRSAAFTKMTEFTGSSSYLDEVYRYFERWLSGDPTTMTHITKSLRNHPNWDYMRKTYRNEELKWYALDSNRQFAFEFGKCTIGGNKPIIVIKINSEGNITDGPKLMLED